MNNITEQDVCDWLKAKLLAIRAGGLPATNIIINAHFYSHEIEPNTDFGAHASGECVTSEPDLDTAIKNLQKECFGNPAAKAAKNRKKAAELLAEAAELEQQASHHSKTKQTL